jgi:hypothetical protein
MIYIINRASDHFIKKESPCEEAVLRPFENWQERSCTEEYFNEHYSQRLGLWRSEDLHKLIDKYGTLIIDNGDSINKTPTITIYDDYME